MSETTDDSTTSSTSSGDRAADDVRRAFSGLPFEQKVSTLIGIQLDILGDAVDTVVSAASKAVDDITTACSEPSGTKTPSSGGTASSS